MNKLIQKILSSEQFEYSEKIMDLRYDNGFTLDDMIRITNLNKQQYLRLEASDYNISVEKYKEAIQKIEEYIQMKKIFEYTKEKNFETILNKEKYSFSYKDKSTLNAKYDIKNEAIYKDKDDFYSSFVVTNKENHQKIITNNSSYHEVKLKQINQEGNIKTLPFAA